MLEIAKKHRNNFLEQKPFKINDKYGIRNFQYDGFSLSEKENTRKVNKLRKNYGRYVRTVRRRIPKSKSKQKVYVRYEILNPKKVLNYPKSNLKYYLKGDTQKGWLSELSDYNYYSLEHLTKYKGKKEGWDEIDRKQAVRMFKKAKDNRKKRKNLDFYS